MEEKDIIEYLCKLDEGGINYYKGVIESIIIMKIIKEESSHK